VRGPNDPAFIYEFICNIIIRKNEEQQWLLPELIRINEFTEFCLADELNYAPTIRFSNLNENHIH
jgi:hypothetical protein